MEPGTETPTSKLHEDELPSPMTAKGEVVAGQIEKPVNTELNESVALALGWEKKSDGTWLNSFSAPVRDLPNFSGDKTDSQVVVQHFDSLSMAVSGQQARFREKYSETMSPEQICLLAVEVLSGKSA